MTVEKYTKKILADRFGVYLLEEFSSILKDAMDEYSLTDEETIARIADQAPRAMSAYFLCLHSAARHCCVSFDRDYIINHAIKSWTKFKNDIRALSRLFILNFQDHGDSIEIQLITSGGTCGSDML